VQQLPYTVCSASVFIAWQAAVEDLKIKAHTRYAFACAASAAGTAMCLAPPGWELVEGAEAITECQNGWYKADWNRNPVSRDLLRRMLLGCILFACPAGNDLSWHPKAIATS
jgi:hypothetical protein